MKIAFAGLSHLGIVSSIAVASKIQEPVVAYDPDAALCDRLKKGDLPISEPGLLELLKKSKSNIHFTSDAMLLKECPLVYVSSDVPTDANNQSRLDVLEKLWCLVDAHKAAKTVRVLMSQVPPGWMRRHVKTGEASYYQVETLIFGRALERALSPERFIVGCADKNDELPSSFRSLLELFNCPVFKMSYESAELAKISINMLLAASVSMTNTLAEVCEKIGADWNDIAPALRADKRIGAHAYLTPGLGLSGGNLERDLLTLHQLAAEHGTEGVMADACLVSSRYRRDWPLRMLREHLDAKDGDPKIALWGLTYKAETHSVKNSPAMDLLKTLPFWPVHAYDPQVSLGGALPSNVRQASSALQACEGADALLVMTAWKEFSSVDLAAVKQKMKGRMILDPWQALDAKKCRQFGFRRLVMGESADG